LPTPALELLLLSFSKEVVETGTTNSDPFIVVFVFISVDAAVIDFKASDYALGNFSMLLN